MFTGDETWYHYFEPEKKKYGRVPVVAKRTISTKKVLKCIYLSCDGKTILIPVPKGKSFIGGIIEI